MQSLLSDVKFSIRYHHKRVLLSKKMIFECANLSLSAAISGLFIAQLYSVPTGVAIYLVVLIPTQLKIYSLFNEEKHHNLIYQHFLDLEEDILSSDTPSKQKIKYWHKEQKNIKALESNGHKGLC